jgi:methanogenic corrinoid protein MtbC1
MVEAEIIPRLMLAHSSQTPPSGSDALSLTPASAAPSVVDERLGPAAAESFTRMALSDDAQSLLAYVGDLLSSGVPMETIYVDLMIPAARRLGEYWDDDSVSFADVTIGLGRLQQVVRTLRWRSSDGQEGPDHAAPSALFAPVSSEQHTFGLFIIEESFRRAGWRTWIETSGVADDAADMVRSHWFDLIGFSAHCDAQVEEVAAAISAVRRASRNRGLFVLVGGRLFIDNPELVLVVGADATAPNGGDALLVADKAVRRLTHSV